MGYSVTSEYAALALAATMLFIMAYSRPRKTKIYYYDFFGMAASIVAILCEVQIVYLAKFPAWVDLPYRINSLIWIYLVFHLLVLLCMVNYVNSFSLSGEGQQSLQRIESWAIVILYVASALIVQFTTGFYEQKILGCNLEWFIRFHTGWGLIVCTLIFVTAIICRNNLSRIVKIDIMLFLPIIIVMLFLQQMSRLSLFSSFCYVLPFTVCYIMFHSNPYDEQTGCQNYYSFAAKIQSILRHHTHYAVATLHYPELDQPFDKERRAKINHAISATCRNMEKLDRKVRIYRTASDMFTVMKTLMPNEHSAEDFLNDIAAAGKYLLSLTDDLHYGHMIGFNSQITDMDANLMEGFNDYLHRTYITEAKTYQVHIATEQDYDDYFEVHTLFRELKDIYTKRDLNDPRVLCYTQPIYRVADHSFRTAEALMRLAIDGKIIAPDKFIPILERENYIHVFTEIMINKVCNGIERMQEEYDFDAITVNCSPAEFSNRCFHSDVLEIISAHQIQPGKLRLEMTENAMFGDIDAVRFNMDRLADAGIKFYLDDFGTGYSNLERVTSSRFSTVKFDKSILYRAMKNEGTDELIEAMVALLKRRGITPLVEGVEDELQSDYCIEKGFDYIQGFKYAKPIPIESLTDYFAKYGTVNT